MKILSYARDEAMRTGEAAVGTDHLMLGLLRHADNDACKALEALGVSLQDLKQSIEGSVFKSRSLSFSEAEHMVFARNAQNTLNLTVIEASMAGAADIRSGHLLLAISSSAGSAAQIYLNSVGATHAAISERMKADGTLVSKVIDPEKTKEAGAKTVSILKILSTPDKICS